MTVLYYLRYSVLSTVRVLSTRIMSTVAVHWKVNNGECSGDCGGPTAVLVRY